MVKRSAKWSKTHKYHDIRIKNKDNNWDDVIKKNICKEEEMEKGKGNKC